MKHPAERIEIQGRRIEYEFLRCGLQAAPVMVFLHEGLGSRAMWKDFPARCARACGCDALVYSRYGHGESDPLTEPRRVDYLHDEALKTLPELLDKLEIQQPFLLGHSDGASIALIHAGASGRPVRGLILLAPHVMVEDFAIQGTYATKHAYENTGLRRLLAQYHAHPDATFRGWSGIWLDPDFRVWNIEEYLPRIACPILSIQGVNDEYGTMEQIRRIATAVKRMDVLELRDCGHSPHRDHPEAVIQATAGFVRRAT